MSKRAPMLHEIQGMEFPDYVYQEYPKWIELPDGRKVIVKDEAEALGLGYVPPPPPKSETELRTEIEAELRAQIRAELEKELG